VALVVDQLQHADHLAQVVRHGDDQHRLGPVAVLCVEPRIEVIAHVVGQLVHIVDHQWLVLDGNVAGDRRMVERDGRLLEIEIRQAGVLSQLEAQMAFAFVGRFGQVQTACVRGSYPEGVPQDHVEQHPVILFQAQLDADVCQFGHFSGPGCQFTLRQRPLPPHRRLPEGRPDGEQHPPPARVARKMGTQAFCLYVVGDVPFPGGAHADRGGPVAPDGVQISV